MKTDALVPQVVEDVAEQPGVAIDEHSSCFILKFNKNVAAIALKILLAKILTISKQKMWAIVGIILWTHEKVDPIGVLIVHN